MSKAIDALAGMVAGTNWELLPAGVQRLARLVLLDTIGVILGGSEQPEVARLRTGLSAGAGSGTTVLARGCPVNDAGRTAFLNGVAGRAIEMCETHGTVSCQAAIQLVPGALAVAERAGRNGRDLLEALVTGYDVAIRLGAATTRRPLAHPLGQTGMLGAIAAGARLRGLDAAGIGTAIRIGGNLMVTAGYGNVVAGATTLNAVGGMSAMAAVNAPELVLAGFTAQHDAIEQTMTELLSVGFDPAPVFDGLGTRWEIAQVLFRLRACCNPIYPALDALADVLARLKPRPDEIERIDVETYDFAAGLGVQEPPGHFGARYSLPHAAAALVVNGHLGYASFTDAMVRDPVLTALRHRVHVVEDKAMTARLPASKPARVTLVLKDGRREAASVEDDRRVGEAFDEAPVRAKYRELAGLVLTDAGVAAVESAIERCEEWPSMAPLLDALRTGGRSAGA
jgi:2-methylcitrate dehydratase PrpD